MGIKYTLEDGQGNVIESYDTRTDEDILEQIKFNRGAGYGTIEEQLDMMYWDQVNGTSTWKDHIDSVKAKHPKTPEGE